MLGAKDRGTLAIGVSKRIDPGTRTGVMGTVTLSGGCSCRLCRKEEDAGRRGLDGAGSWVHTANPAFFLTRRRPGLRWKYM